MKKHFLWALIASIALVSPVLAANDLFDDEPLEPDKAFQFKAFAKDANTITAQWAVHEGYYMYRDKLKFKAGDGVVLGSPILPKGKMKEDETFGNVETYRKTLTVEIPVKQRVGDDVVFTASYQGCADIGLCYPPITKTVTIPMPPAADFSTASGAATPSLFSKLSSSLGFGAQQQEFLKPDEAFIFSAEVIDGNNLRFSWNIADGYYLYREKFSFALTNGDGVQLAQAAFPAGKEKIDEAFGKMEVYYHEVEALVPLLRTNLSATDIKVKVDYQGCADAGFCYPPMDKTVKLSLPSGKPGNGVAMGASGPGVAMSEQDSIAQSLANDSLFWVILTFFGFGLLLSLTPCVFPMVPILSSIIVGQGESITARKGFVLSLVYVLAMALTYTVAGVIAGLFGSNLQAAFQEPWILISFSVVFVLLSLSMFGFYELQIPASWQAKLSEISNSQQGGTLTGVAIMGLLSALIVGPCVAAPLMGALIYIGQTGDAVLGGVALFALSMGMGAPLILIGASAGKLLPRAGVWMEAVKAVFGVMLLAVAIWMLERILPQAVTLFLWGLLLIIPAIYMGAMEHLHDGSSGWKRLWKGLGIVMLVYGVLLVIGAASGADDPLRPLAKLSGGNGSSAVAAQQLKFKKVKSVDDLDRELAAASAANKPVMLDFYADWCVSCKEMERYTFSDAKVQNLLAQGVLLKADVTANDATDQALLKRFRLIGPPSMIFWDRSGNEQNRYRLVGFLPADKFHQHVQQVFN